MSGSIPPVNTEVVDGEEIRQYDLPESGETAFNVDTSREGYTVEWRVSKDFGVTQYEDFLWNLEQYIEENYAEITIESSGKESGDFHELILLEGYPENCSYLRLETEGFDLEWESWTDSNRIMLSAPENNTVVLTDVFEDFYESHNEQLLGDHHRLALKEARKVIDRDHRETASRLFE